MIRFSYHGRKIARGGSTVMHAHDVGNSDWKYSSSRGEYGNLEYYANEMLFYPVSVACAMAAVRMAAVQSMKLIEIDLIIID